MPGVGAGWDDCPGNTSNLIGVFKYCDSGLLAASGVVEAVGGGGADCCGVKVMTDGQFDNADVFGVAGVAFDDGSAAGALSSSSESEMVMTSCGLLLLLAAAGTLSQEPGRWPGYLSATM